MMTELKIGEKQQELFEEFSKEVIKPERFPSFHRPQKPILITTSVEQIVLASILFVLAGCLIFFIGVLRGKSLKPSTAPLPAARVVASKPQQRLVSNPGNLSAKTSVSTASSPVVTTKSAPAIAEPQSNPPKKPYTIQLVTYKKQDLAEQEASALRKNGFYAIIIPSGDYYQVCVGQYGSKEEAQKDLALFGRKYKDCFLRRK
jgi:hypothetical protein